MQRYGMRARRNNPGASDENGAIEARQATTKHFIEQALLLRTSREFDTLDQYRGFIAAVSARANARVTKAVCIERAHRLRATIPSPISFATTGARSPRPRELTPRKCCWRIWRKGYNRSRPVRSGRVKQLTR